MRKILEDAAVVGNATARTVTFAARPEEGFAFYPGSEWCSALFVSGYQFLDPPPKITATGPVMAPSDGARKLDSRANFFYMATGATPAMCMRLTGIGSQYIYAMRDSDGNYFDGGRNCRLTLPADIPESRFWSLILYDRQTRSVLQTDQHLPDLGSQSGAVARSIREAVRGAPTTSHWLVLDAEGIAQIDTTGTEALGRVVDELHDDGVTLVVARMRTRLKARLDDAGLDAQIGADHFYPTVQAAVHACVREEATRAAMSAN